MSAASTSADRPPLRLILARHGESEANTRGVFANRPGPGGDLTARGISQARDLAAALAGRAIAHVYSSPLPRAAQTAGIIAGSFGVSISYADGLREYDVGDYEGLPYTGPHAWRMERYEEIEAAWRDGDRLAAHPGGESLADLEARFRGFLDNLVADHRPGNAILAITHGGLLRVVLPVMFPAQRDLFLRRGFDYGVTVALNHSDGGWMTVAPPSR